MRSTVMIVEWHDVLRMALRDWLSTAFVACRWLEATNGEEAIAIARLQKPDLVLMDIGQIQMDGIRVTERLLTVVPQSRVILIALHDGPESRSAAAAAGASGYMPLGHITTDLIPLMQRLLCEADVLSREDGRGAGAA